MKATHCQDFPSSDLLEDQKMERLKKMQSFFYSKAFKQSSLHLYTELLITKNTLSITNE